MIKKLLSYLKEYKFMAIITPFIVSGEAIIEVIIPFMMSKLIELGIGEVNPDGTVVSGDIKYVFIYGGLMVLLAIISLILGALAAKTAVTASQGFAKNLRKAEFEKIQSFSFANVDKFSTASLITRLTTDVTNTAQSFQMIIRMMVRSPVMLIFAMIMSIRVNAQLSLIFLIALPFLGIMMWLMMKLALPYFKKMLDKYDAMNASVQENLIGIRVVKAFVREDYETVKFKKTSLDVRNSQAKAERILNLGQPVFTLCMYICMLGVAFFGGKQIIIGKMAYGDLTAFISYVMQILMSLIMIAVFFVNFSLSRASMDRIYEVLKEIPDIDDSKANSELLVTDGSIEFKNVDFSYSKNSEALALQGVNISIKSGETIGILGGTGTSKSTFVQLIPRLYDVTNGEVLVANHNVKEYSLVNLRDSVAMVLQKNVLFSGTIKDNLKWGNENATDEEIIEACKKAQAHDFIMSFPDQYETYLGQGGVNVSGGQKQRLCIARALLKKPKILILDDSTSAVDTATDAKIRDALKNDLKEATKIIIAQRVSSIEKADRIIVMDDGKINQIGTHDELLKTNIIYKDVYESQMKGAE